MAKKEVEEKVQDGAQIRVSLSGSPDEVMERIGGSKSKDEKAETSADKVRKINDCLREPNNTANAKRLFPTKLHNRQLTQTLQLHLPTNLNEVKNRISNELGGKTWHVEVFDPEGVKVTGTTIDIDEPPKPVFVESAYDNNSSANESPYYHNRTPWALRGDDDDEEDDESDLDEMIKTEKKMLIIKRLKDMQRGDDGKSKPKEVERLETSIRDLQGNLKDILRENKDSYKEAERRYQDGLSSISSKLSDAIKSIDNKMEKNIQNLEKMIIDSKHEKELAALREQMKEKDVLQTLKGEIQNTRTEYEKNINKLITELQRDDGKGGNDMFLEVIRSMREGTDATLRSINDSINSRMDHYARASTDSKELFLELLREKRTSSPDPLQGAKSIIDIAAGVAGLRGGGGEDAPVNTEDRLIKAFSDVAPQVIDYMRERKASGKQIDEDEIEKAIAKKAREIAKAAMKKSIEEKKAIVGKEQKQLAKPKEEESEVEETPEQNIKNRVNYILRIINDEIDVMPLEPEWIDNAIKYLPREQLEALAKSEKPKDMLPILKDYADEALMGKIGIKLLLSKEKTEWINRCLNLLKQIVNEMIEEEKIASSSPTKPDEKPNEDTELDADDGVDASDFFDDEAGELY